MQLGLDGRNRLTCNLRKFFVSKVLKTLHHQQLALIDRKLLQRGLHLRSHLLLLKPFIQLHLNLIIPTLGRLVAGESDAYHYLPDSTQAFQGPEQLAGAMRAAGLVDVNYRLFMFGTIGVHVGTKPA